MPPAIVFASSVLRDGIGRSTILQCLQVDGIRRIDYMRRTASDRSDAAWGAKISLRGLPSSRSPDGLPHGFLGVRRGRGLRGLAKGSVPQKTVFPLR